mmetsp:Transcript_3006/g.4494  ORF Transcript_3006/g.4494 Transcript_3006/m.4494 type:complete len:289 (+) Transcript_3006:76-942(+)
MMFLSSVQKSAALRAPVSALLRRQNSSFVSSKTALTVSNGRRRKQTPSLRSISQTPLLKAQITVNVPTMGDSITEGTIVEWCVPPGSNFREGDVLALVETDKVTVDIKAERDGVLIKQLGEVDDNVEVGAGLYILDTDVQNVDSAVLETNMSEVNESIDATKAGEVEVSEPISKSTTRIPSIHFLGKDGWKARLTATDTAAPAAPTASATTVLKSDKPNSPTSITQIQYKPMEGRPLITEEEMEALVLGGALEAPDVKTLISEDGLKGVAFVGGKITTAGPRGVWLAA